MEFFAPSSYESKGSSCALQGALAVPVKTEQENTGECKCFSTSMISILNLRASQVFLVARIVDTA